MKRPENDKSSGCIAEIYLVEAAHDHIADGAVRRHHDPWLPVPLHGRQLPLSVAVRALYWSTRGPVLHPLLAILHQGVLWKEKQEQEN